MTAATTLQGRLCALAQLPQVLVACDYDGTIAPIVDDPLRATPRRETVVALRAIAELPQTHVAVISGRSLRDLAALSRLPTEIHLVGSHGSEFDVGFGSELATDAVALRDELRALARDVAARHPGTLVEAKPASVAFHHRMAADDVAAAALDELHTAVADRASVHVRAGDKVLELSVIETDKGRALESIRHRVGATAVLYLGDSVTDEDAFAALAGPDIGVKVGTTGETTAAEFSVADPAAVTELLASFCAHREQWLAGAAAVPIEHHSMLSDQRTAAIVTPDARVVWYCAPRIDSSAVFAELVGGPSAGAFAIAPANGGRPIGQRYVEDTLVLETTWPELRVTDYLDCSGGRPDRLAGRSDLVRVVEGRGSVTITFAPRLDFGRFPTQLAVGPDGIEVVGAADLLALRAPGVTWTLTDDGRHHTAIGEATLDDGPLVLEFRCGTASTRPDARDEASRRVATESFWSSWVTSLRFPPAWRDEVGRSALTLKALCYRPTGAIVAAPTTSLPEHIGGVRNWDYRYCWLRDAALSAAALVRLGSHAEAMAYLDWVLAVLEHRDDPERLQPLYNVAGRHLPPEAEIAELAGYAGSRPVRVGNAAERQVQLDVFGPVVDLIALLLDDGAPLSARHWRLVEAMVQAVERRWQEPDHGIWEIRKPPRHHVYSKVMCWVTVDRALRVAPHFVDRPRPEWERLRDEIAADVGTHGWKPKRHAFGAAYDGDDLDASVLMIGISGMVAPDDERFGSTVQAVEAELFDGHTVHRYLDDDGLPGREGGFTLMTSWLVDAFALVGRTADARSLFDRILGLAGPTGLLSEEYDAATGRALGNHPQAYSHLGLIDNALRLSST